MVSRRVLIGVAGYRVSDSGHRVYGKASGAFSHLYARIELTTYHLPGSVQPSLCVKLPCAPGPSPTPLPRAHGVSEP